MNTNQISQNKIKEFNRSIKRGILDNRKRQLIINPDFIQFEDKDLLSTPFTRFEKGEIADYRYGIRWLRGFEFKIGREYQIFIRNRNSKIIKINFKSFYGIKRQELHNTYAQIIESLWDFYFSDITKGFMEKFYNGQGFEIGNVHFTDKSIRIKMDGMLREQIKLIPWDKLGTRDYHTYFAIYSTEDPTNIDRGYNYLDDWNTGVLYSVIRTILRDKNISDKN